MKISQKKIRRNFGQYIFLTVLMLGSPQANADATVSCLTPRPLHEFIDSFGMNTHMQQGWQYADAAKTVGTLQALGITQVRDSFTGLGHAGLEYAARKGIKFDFVIHAGWDLQKAIPGLESWEKEYPGSILSIEGPNEVNNWPVSYKGLTGIPAAQAFQSDLYNGIHSSEILKGIPVVALTSWPVFRNKSDVGNVHPYARGGGYTTPDLLSSIKEEKTGNPPEKPIWATEGGYTTHVGAGYFEGVSEDAQAKMILAFYLSAFTNGVAKTFVYQLADQYTDPNDQQAFFGVVDLKWRPKPAYIALKEMIATLRSIDETGPAAKSLDPMAYMLKGLPVTARHLLLQAKNGDKVLAIWNEAEIWDRNAHRPLPPSSHDTSLQLKAKPSTVRIFDPFVGSAPITTETDVDAVKFTLGDHPLLIVIGDEAANQAGPKKCESSFAK